MTEFQLYLAIAIASTLLFVGKMVLMIMGGDTGADVDGGDFNPDLHDGDAQVAFKLLSTQAILAFFMGAGWMGLAARFEMGFGRFLTLVIAAAFGAMMTLLTAYLLKQMYSLNRAGRFDITKAAGQTGTVYARIPPKGEGEGQVKIEVAGRDKVLRAVNMTDEALDSFSHIVVQRVDNELLFVKPKK